VNILITGATGFIGRHLTGALSKTYPVRCLVRKTSDISVLRNSNVEIAYGDLLIKDSLRPALDGIDLVYHLAGEVYSRKKVDYYKGNILATQNLLGISKEKGVKRIIYLSSVAVNKPLRNSGLLNEESECAPITLYGITKLEAERLIKESDLPFVIARAPVVYGPYQPPAINKFFLDAITKKKVYVIGHGENLRSLCFANNLTDGLMLLANSSGTEGKTFILSDEEPYTFNQIIHTISKVICQKIKIIYLPNILGDISWQVYNLMGNLFDLYFVELYAIRTMQMHLGCDITKAKKEIAYKPSVSLDAGVKNTVEWIENCCV
jgi:nucleoside-diphosphate-sugar epimerase